MSPADPPQLHLVTDSRLGPEALLGAVEAAAHNGVDWVQVRDHSSTARELFELSRRIVSICRPLGVRVVVNDRIDVALAVAADAVQLGSRSLPIAVAKRIAGPMLIGASVHSLSEGVNAERDGADWITFGHFFPTSSHPKNRAETSELKRGKSAQYSRRLADGVVHGQSPFFLDAPSPPTARRASLRSWQKRPVFPSSRLAESASTKCPRSLSGGVAVMLVTRQTQPVPPASCVPLDLRRR